jgi:ATP:ADP antiporter, AAA family
MTKKSKAETQEFSRLKSVFWPIHNRELKKFLPLSLLCFFCLFDYSVLRGLREAVIVPKLGAEIVSTLELYGVLPIAIFFMISYFKLVNHFHRETLFYSILGLFLAFFAFFAYYLHPAAGELHPCLSHVMVEYPYFKYPLLMAENWTSALFYVMTVLWGSVVVSLLFWQFVNFMTTFKEARRYYALLVLLGNFGVIAGSYITKYIASTKFDSIAAEDHWQFTLVFLTNTVLVTGVMLMVIYRWINTHVIPRKEYFSHNVTASEKPKMSVMDSLKYISRSKYLGLIALMIVCFGISIELLENLWKSKVVQEYSTSSEYCAFMAEIQIYTGMVIVFISLIGISALRKLSWLANAIATPILLLTAGIIFFTFILFEDEFSPMLTAVGTSSLMVAIWIGSVQNIIGRASRYSIFEATKELSYRPLERELQTKGRAAVDVVGERFGKGLSSVVQQGLLTFIPGSSLMTLSHELFFTFIAIMIAWLFAVTALNKIFMKLAKEKEEHEH